MADENTKPLRPVIERGSRADFDALARHHYLAGPPATFAGVWRARVDTPAGPALAGVLVASFPTLNGAWRALAWPGRYTTDDHRADAARLNAEVRCLSRVIVEPRFRGTGVASSLVRHYLADPLTTHTEAAASMGRVCPFFLAAGMTEYRLAPSPAACRLIDALETRGYRVWHLADERTAERLARDPFLADELARWARAARLPRDSNPAHAAARLGGAPVAYTHSVGQPPKAPPDERTLPRPITLFVRADERAAIRRALRRLDPDPARAIKRLLGVPD